MCWTSYEPTVGDQIIKETLSISLQSSTTTSLDENNNIYATKNLMVVINWVCVYIYIYIFAKTHNQPMQTFLLLHPLVVETLVVIAYNKMMIINKIKKFMLTKFFIHD